MAKQINIEDIFDKSILNNIYLKAIEQPKSKISQIIKQEIKNKNLSLRKLANMINQKGDKDYRISYSQICRITSGESYNVNSLFKILEALDLEINIVNKKET